MKYLNNRDYFLKQSKPEIRLIKENVAGAGPFANEITWGDSLLGRLVNHFTRKAGIGVDMMKIKNVTSRLDAEFRSIIDNSMILSVSDEDKTNINRLKISALIGKLRDSVYNKEKVSVIKSVCDNTISEIEKIKEADLGTDLNNSKKELLEKLKEFRKFLDQFKDEEGKEGKEEVEDKNDVYSNYVENFKIVLKLCEAYSILKKSKETNIKKSSTIEIGKFYKWKDDSGKEIKVKVDKIVGDKAEIVIDGKSKQILVTSLYESEKQSVFVLLKSLYNYIVTSLPVDKIDGVIKMNLNDEKFKNPITKIYSVVRKSNLISEDINNLLTRPEEIGNKISQLYSVTKSKPDGKFDGLSPEIQNLISQFNSTMLKCLTSESKKEEPTKESFITNYSKFIKLVEAEGDSEKTDDSNPDKIKVQTTSDKIIDYFDKNMNFEAWVIEKTEAEKIEKNIEKYQSGENKEIVLAGIDPILNIVKLFNRAYKIHTVNVIPGARTGGSLSGIGGRKVFNEYDAFGYTSGEPNSITQGPYRNKKVFNIWEDAVLDVMSKREYQPIFDKKTKIQVGNEFKTGIGVVLRQFITDMLDGEKLYKGDRGEGGSSQKKFLAKYFGDFTDKDLEKILDGEVSFTGSGGKSDLDVVNGIANKIDTPKYEFIFEDKVKPNDYEGIVFKLEGKTLKDSNLNRYGFVKSIEGGFCYIIYSNSFFKLSEICRSSIKGGSPEFGKGNSKGISNNPTDSTYYLTKIKKESFDKMITQRGTSLELQGNNTNATDDKKEFIIESSYILSNNKDDKWATLRIKDRSTITDWSNKNNVPIDNGKAPESTIK